MSSVNVAKESVADWNSGNGTVGTTPQAIGEYPVKKHVVIRATTGNTGTIGLSPNAGSAANGFILGAGETSPPIYVDDLNKVFVVGSAASQSYSWICT